MNVSTPSAEATPSWEAIRVVARVWISRATGLLRAANNPRLIVPVVRGGLPTADGVVALRELLCAGELHFQPAAVRDPGDREALAQVVIRFSLDRARRSLPDGRGIPALRFLVAPDGLAESGFLDAPSTEAGAPGSGWLAWVVALERLGFVKVKWPLVDLPVEENVGLALVEEEVEVDMDMLDSLGLDIADFDGIAANVSWDEEDAAITAGLDTVRALLMRGQWPVAERILTSLVDRRLDHPRVLATLAMVKVLDPARLGAQRIGEARRLLQMATQLESGSDTRLFAEVDLSIGKAEYFLANGPVILQRAQYAAGMGA